jgi:hypothetical protein
MRICRESLEPKSVTVGEDEGLVLGAETIEIVVYG